MLEVANLSVSYGRHLALDQVSVQVGAGETVVILGANGAGKSSLLKAIAGIVATMPGGSVTFDGRQVLGLPAHSVPDLGLALVPEGRGIFGQLTVAENLLLGTYPRRARDGAERRLDTVFDLFPRLAERRGQAAGTMSGGEQQMVAIGRALMTNPRCLLLDEPSLGLAPIVVKELFSALGRVRETGMAMLLVEQNVSISLALASRGYLMETGRIVGAGTAEQLRSDPAVQEAFLGGVTTDSG